MKKKLQFKKLLLMALMLVGAGSAWAAERSYTLTFKTTGTGSDGSTAWSSSSAVSDVLTGGADYVSSISAAEKVYPARDGRGAKFGTSSAAGSITFALSNDGKVKATKVVIKGGAYISSSKAEAAAVKVNGGDAVAFDQTVTSYTEGEITYDFAEATEISTLSLQQATAKNGRFYIVSVTVYYEDNDERETPTWTLDPTSATVKKGKTTVLQLTTTYDGTLTFESADPEIATVSYNATSKQITVTGVALGTTTISATGAATTNYKAIDKTINVTVIRDELDYNVVDPMGPFGYAYFGLTPEGSNTYAQPDVTSTDKADNYGVTISFARAGSSNTKPRFDENYVRFYKGNTLTISAPEGSLITKVVFVEPTSGAKWDGSISVEVGEYDNSSKTWYAEGTGVEEIILTGITSTNRIGGLEIYMQATKVNVAVSAVGYATFVCDANLDYSNVTGLKAYRATVSGDDITFTKVTTVPAGEGVLLQGTGTFEVPIIASATAWGEADNAFVRGTGAAVSTGTGPYNYILNVVNDVVGFYKAAGQLVAKDKAYLQTSTASARAFMPGAETTGIKDNNREAITNNRYFDLQGREVAQPTKGLYIVNGTKVVIK